ncbi:response regulator transcription factor [Neobacillus sp. Marseille-QA0830]
MKKLLIVDDEPYTVDGLYFMISDYAGFDFELYTAYSADEAIQRLLHTKMDIVISDIKMPGMDGLELQRWISNRWPGCKVIFLTGFGDIQYAQAAIRLGCCDYILKTEGDESIIKSIKKALSELDQEALNEQIIIQAKENYTQVLPLLRKQWFNEMLDVGRFPLILHESKFKELQMNLSVQEQVLLIGGRVDKWKESDDLANQLLMMDAIQNIVEEHLRLIRIQTILMEGSEMIWLIQPNNSHDVGLSLTNIHPWEDTLSYVKGSMESIQAACKKLLKLPISLVCNGKPISWEEIGKTYSKINQMMVLGVGNGEEMLISNCEEEPLMNEPDAYRRYFADFEQCLETGDEEECKKILAELFYHLPPRYGVFAEIYYKVAVHLLESINKLQINLQEERNQEMERLLNFSAHKSKNDALQVLMNVIGDLYSKKRSIQDERTHRVIHKLNKYIRENLSMDLSLDTLANLVYMNPSYLSTLYKQYTGKNISDYITDLRVGKAKELLLHSSLKIHEIGEKVGFSTAGYFTRFFKKHVGVTPQEYRN